MDKKDVLDRIKKNYGISDLLYKHIYKNFEDTEKRDLVDEVNFLQSLNPNLRNEVAMIIYKEKYIKIKFLRSHADNENFIGWVCPLLKPLLIVKNEFIF